MTALAEVFDAALNGPVVLYALLSPVLFGFCPELAVRLVAMLYPPGSQERRSLPADVQDVPFLKRWHWIASAAGAALFDGLPQRVRRRKARRQLVARPGVFRDVEDLMSWLERRATAGHRLILVTSVPFAVSIGVVEVLAIIRGDWVVVAIANVLPLLFVAMGVISASLSATQVSGMFRSPRSIDSLANLLYEFGFIENFERNYFRAWCSRLPAAPTPTSSSETWLEYLALLDEFESRIRQLRCAAAI